MISIVLRYPLTSGLPQIALIRRGRRWRYVSLDDWIEWVVSFSQRRFIFPRCDDVHFNETCKTS